jgi:hypothetical protein
MRKWWGQIKIYASVQIRQYMDNLGPKKKEKGKIGEQVIF